MTATSKMKKLIKASVSWIRWSRTRVSNSKLVADNLVFVLLYFGSCFSLCVAFHLYFLFLPSNWFPDALMCELLLMWFAAVAWLFSPVSCSPVSRSLTFCYFYFLYLLTSTTCWLKRVLYMYHAVFFFVPFQTVCYPCIFLLLRLFWIPVLWILHLDMC